MRTESLLPPSILIIALAPYATIGLPFALGIRLQVAIILVGLLVAAVPARRGLPRLRGIPRPLVWGLGLYAAVAVWGTLVGLFAGNPIHHVAGQLVSMALLPLAAAIYALHGAALRASTVVTGLGLAATVALVAHGVGYALGFAGSRPGGAAFRLVLEPNVDATAPALLALLVVCGWWLATGSRWALAAALAAALLIVGSQSRGAWGATLLGLVVLVVRGIEVFPRRRVTALAVAVTAALVLIASAGWWVERSATVVARLDVEDPRFHLPRRGLKVDPERALLTIEAPGGKARRYPLLGADRPVVGRAVALSARLQGDPGQQILFWIKPRPGKAGPDAPGKRFALTASGVWQDFGAVVVLPATTSEPTLSLYVLGGESWQIETLELRVYRTLAASWLHDLSLRRQTLVAALLRPARDPTLDYRLREWRAVRESWHEGGWERALAGRGLGALFAFPSYRLVDRRTRVPTDTSNYIHNFYLFLAFKLGLAGAVALAGLAAIAVWTWRVGRGGALAAPSRALPQAAAAAWAAFALWSITSPELLNFRVAPLWGLLIAACWASVLDRPTDGISGTKRTRRSSTSR